MGGVGRGSADGEQVLYRSRPHWMALGWPLFWVVAVAVGAVVLVIAAPGAPLSAGYGLAAAAAVAGVWLAGRTIRWATTTLCVTTLRFSERSGVLSRHGSEILLDRIAEISYRQSLPAMVLGGGQLVIDSGAGAVSTVDHVRRPAQLQSLITEQLSALSRSSAVQHDGRGGSGAPDSACRCSGFDPVSGWVTPPSGMVGGWEREPTSATQSAEAAQRLATLVDLHRRGLVNDGEFAAKRAEIIRRL